MISMAYSLISPGTTGLRASRVSGCQGFPALSASGSIGAMRRLQPAARDFALVQIRPAHRARLRARSCTRDVRPDILQDDDPVGVVLIDRGEQVERDRPRDQHVVRAADRSGSAASGSALVCVGGICTNASGGTELVGARRRERLGAQPLPAVEIELGPLRFRQRPVVAGAPAFSPITQYLTGGSRMMPVSMPLSQ